ncbi:MAG: aminomethyl-transferring glycine dehydrogenase subunit GcvPA [Planctomycetota bacterium]|jgi:glycine dehydrogenase subunit 1
MKYTQLTEDNVAHMLATIGVDSIESLFSPVPEDTRLDRHLDIPRGLSELEMIREARTLAAANRSCEDNVCFLGAGAYDHFIPSVVDALSVGQSEFLTAYTPYQAEASQGILQLFYEFQTMVAMLTGMEVANASLYEFASTMAEAMIMATGITRRNQAVVAGNVHPDMLRVLSTYAQQREVELVTVPHRGGVIDEAALKDAIGDATAAVVVQSPNFFGCVERLDRIITGIHEVGAMALVCTDPLAGGVLKTPGALGADVVVAEGQPLGIPLQYGGPYLGIMAGREKHLRKMPGRIVGVTTDTEGRRGFCLAMQTREQHIKRERATSNVCTNQGLLAVRASVYMAALGKEGLAEVASQCLDKAHYAADRIAALEGFSLAFTAPFFKEFTVQTTKDVAAVLDACRARGVWAGVPLTRFDDSLADCFMVAVTEKRSKEEIDSLVAALESA